MSGDADEVLVSFRDGTIVSVPAGDPAAGSTEVAQVSQVLGQLAVTSQPGGLGEALVVSLDHSSILAVGLSDAQVRSLVGVANPTGVTADGTFGDEGVWAAGTTVGEGRLHEVMTDSAHGVADGLLPTGHVSTTADERLLVAHPAADRVTVVDMASGSTTALATDQDLSGHIVEVRRLDDGRFLLVTTEELAMADDIGDLTVRPRLVPPAEPLFVGSWVPLQYDLSGTSYSSDDLSFEVHGGTADAALVHHTSMTPGGHRVPVLVVGGVPGSYEVSMGTSSGLELDRATFEVTDHWSDRDHGPSQMLQGPTAPPPGGAGQDDPAGPENLGTNEHRGDWHVLILLVNTADGAFPTDPTQLDAVRQKLLDEVVNGVNFDGRQRSVRGYYEELSAWDSAVGRGLTIDVHKDQVFGPVTLPGGWTDYFEERPTGSAGSSRWWPMPGQPTPTAQTIITQSINAGLVTRTDYAEINVLLMVPSSPGGAPGAGTPRFVWPNGSIKPEQFLAGTKPGEVESFAYVFMPPDWQARDGRQFHTSLAHELGHTLGLSDLYDIPGNKYVEDAKKRIITGGWDMMAGSRDSLPHFSMSNRLRLGWVDPGTEHKDFKLYKIDKSQPATNEDVVLHAASLGSPPPGRVRGIEIRKARGWNYYVEYRARQASQIGDAVPEDRRVLITDVVPERFLTPAPRPVILFGPKDLDGDGPILAKDMDYWEDDLTIGKMIRVTVKATEADHAIVNVAYRSETNPDPGIHPWAGGPAWQSPDIEIRNSRSAADPAHFHNTLWAGMANTIVAKVRNNGDRACKGVLVDFFLVDMATGPAAEVHVGTTRDDIPAFGTTEFSSELTLPVKAFGHYCVVVRIRPYHDPLEPEVVEVNPHNNEARSNYTCLWSIFASPSSRAVAEVQLTNPYDEATVVGAVVRQTHEHHRVYLDHRWLRVPGGESLPVQVFDEALMGFPGVDDVAVAKDLFGRANQVSVEGWAEPPQSAVCGSPTLTGGVGIRVDSGRATRTLIESGTVEHAVGAVAFVDGSSGADGRVLVVVRETDSTGAIIPGGDQVTAAGAVVGGLFQVGFSRPLEANHGVLQAHYLGGHGAAPSESEQVVVHQP
ncbi:hypothetical protein ABT324_02510 [Saccharopolyspora sp. NPDC000359]|uniref:hypothetical protein n=1 Tax=Saccharopolyspora sp. NPDC000359 TaxID=3154251 RepID=UPI00332F28D2